MNFTYALISASSFTSWSTGSFLIGASSESAQRLALQNRRDHDFTWLLIMTAIVVIGVMFEGPEIVHDFRKAWARCKHKPYKKGDAKPWITLIGAIGWLLIVVGVAGEFVAEEIVSNADRAIETFNTIQLGKAETTAGEANERASNSETEAAALRKEADTLEAQIAPRRLTPDQEAKITKNCEGFKELFEGKHIRVVSYSLDTESLVFSEQIVSALHNSGMWIDDDSMSITPMGTLVFGINVFGSDSQLAKKIAGAIGSSGKPIAVGFVEKDPTADAMHVEYSKAPHEVTVLVGLKPFDPNTVKELKKIVRPAPKPTNP